MECEKPTVDFFKDIFLSDSDEENPVDNMPTTTNHEKETDHETNISSNVPDTTIYHCSPKGIFADLNFDGLFSSKISNEPKLENEIDNNQTDNINNIYGPLPENKPLHVNPVIFNPIENTSTDDEWTEKSPCTDHKSNKKKHKKHKHKKKKKKSHK